MNDQMFMLEAIAEARRALGVASPNPPVGAVVVAKGKIVGRGHTAPVGGPHAEVEALRSAGNKARGGTLYTTLEPCDHLGRTPPCTQRILNAGIRRVVIGIRDENPLVKGRGLKTLVRGGLQVDLGVERESCLALAKPFFVWVTQQRPYVFLKIAMSLDGRIATRTQDARWISGKESRARVHEWRSQVDAVMVGAGTVRADNPRLTARPIKAFARDPLRVVVDGKLSSDPKAAIFTQKSRGETWVVGGGQAALNSKRETFEAQGTRVLSLPARAGKISLPVMMAALGEAGVTNLMVEGGGGLFEALIRERIFDELRIFMAPVLVGGGLSFFSSRKGGAEKISDALRVRRVSMEILGEDLLMVFAPKAVR